MDLAGKRFVVAGGAGFIGSHVVDRIVRLGGQVVALDDCSVGKEENVAGAVATGRARFLRGDIRDLATCRAALEGADVVFNLAVQCIRVSFNDPSLVHEVNATGTLNLLRAARERGVKRFVYVSSSEVYGSAQDAHEPMDESHPLLVTTPYGASKAAGELYTSSFHVAYGLPTTIVRGFNTYGPRSHANGAYGEVIPRFVARVLAGERPVVFGDGEQTRDFTYVEDTARGMVAAGLHDALVGETVNIARGREITINAIARAVANVCGRPAIAPLHDAPRPADVRRHHANTKKAERLCGFRAEIEIEEGIGRYLAWVRERGVEVSAAEAASRNWESSEPKR